MSIKLINILKNYNTEIIFENFNYEFSDKKISCVLGSSGCGKTTLLNIISGLTEYSGSIEGVYGDISYMFQEPRLLNNLTVYNNVDYVLRKKIQNKGERDAVVNKYLELVEMAEWKNKFPNQLSGGMSQRVSLARAFAYPSSVLLMDEAFKGLDVALKTRLIKVFLKLWEKDKRTTIMVTHDIYEALLIADNISIIKDKPAKIAYSTDILLDKNERTLIKTEIAKVRDAIYSNML